MLTVTDRAAAAVRSVCADRALGLRVMVASGGCAGLQYSMGLESEAGEGDEVIACAGAMVFVDPASALWLAGATLDFVDNDQGAGFVFDTPAAKEKCSCSGGRC